MTILNTLIRNSLIFNILIIFNILLRNTLTYVSSIWYNIHTLYIITNYYLTKYKIFRQHIPGGRGLAQWGPMGVPAWALRVRQYKSAGMRNKKLTHKKSPVLVTDKQTPSPPPPSKRTDLFFLKQMKNLFSDFSFLRYGCSKFIESSEFFFALIDTQCSETHCLFHKIFLCFWNSNGFRYDSLRESSKHHGQI